MLRFISILYLTTKMALRRSEFTLLRTAYPESITVRLILLNTRTIGEGQVLVNWQTAEALNLSGFQLKKSLVAKTLIIIPEISYHSSFNAYFFTDNTNLNYADPIYYRLKLKDPDDSLALSQIISVDSKSVYPISFSAYLNPFIYKIEVCTEANEDKNVSITLMNRNRAHLLSRNAVVPNNKLTLEINDQLIAEYILSVSTYMRTQKIKMVKNL